MSSKQDPEKSGEDQFAARGESERRSAIDRLQADMQKDRSVAPDDFERGAQVDERSAGLQADRALSQGQDQVSYFAVAVQLLKDLRIGHHLKTFGSYMLLRSPGMAVGAIVGFAVGTRPSGFQGIAPLFLALQGALFFEALRRRTIRFAARNDIQWPDVSLMNHMGGVVGGLAGCLIISAYRDWPVPPILPVICCAVVGEAFYRLLKYAVPD